MWQMDADGRFSLGSDAFTRLIGVRTAASFGRPWNEIAREFALDPEGLVVKAIATREAWSGITLNWPADDGSRLPVELSGLPIHDARKISSATAALAFAAILKAWRGSTHCAVRNSSTIRHQPT